MKCFNAQENHIHSLVSRELSYYTQKVKLPCAGRDDMSEIILSAADYVSLPS